jgi:hypothetical protein
VKRRAKRPTARLPEAVFLPNAHDRLAIEKLRSAPVGELAVDLLVGNNRQMALQNRDVFIGIFFDAAKARELHKATRDQLSSASKALTCVQNGIEFLDAASTQGSGLLRILAGGFVSDDEKGKLEMNRFAAACWKIRLQLVPVQQALQAVTTVEIEKAGAKGERRKRLRTLVDGLASWWVSEGRGSIAPYVKANRRDGGAKAVIHGRSGKFLEFALALFCEVDTFKKSEAEAAVINVYKARAAAREKKRRG